MSSDQRATIQLRFESLAPAAANRAAAELRDQIERTGDDVAVEIHKERTDTQDFGATLVLVLGTEAAIVLAKAVHAFVSRRGHKVVIETPDGKVLATGAAAQNIDVAETVAAIRAQVDAR